jgi:hypothetical protein
VGESSDQRTRRLIDALIDHAHLEWPTVTFVLRLPSGEELLVPRHVNGLAQCQSGHAGYYSHHVRPFCQFDPVPRHRGSCRVAPLPGGSIDVPTYVVDLRSGVLETVGTTSDSA